MTPKKKEGLSLKERKAEAFITAMALFGIFLASILPIYKGEAFLLCLAIGFAGAYYEKRTRETWRVIIKVFKKFLSKFGLLDK